MANLTRLKMLEDFDGVLLVDKPAGIPFPSVVKAVKRKFNIEKVGHGGSLDPASSGLLVLLVNGANARTGDVMGADRQWEGSMRLGLSTDTFDIQGSALETKTGPAPEPQALLEAAKNFKGDVFLTESRWCSVRREGSAGYEKADTGEHKPFLAHVYRFDVAPAEGAAGLPASLPFKLYGTKGVILRSLVSDFGKELGCGAALESSRRTAVGRFKVEDAVPFDKLLEADQTSFRSLCISLSKAFG